MTDSVRSQNVKVVVWGDMYGPSQSAPPRAVMPGTAIVLLVSLHSLKPAVTCESPLRTAHGPTVFNGLRAPVELQVGHSEKWGRMEED